jgi:type I restriction enzyme S subunit
MCISQTNYGLKAANGVPDNFLRFAVEGAVEGLRQESYGTIFDTITTKNLSATQVVLPTPQVLASFANRTDPLMSAVLLNLRLIETLAEARDTLLPKLFSGEIRFMVDS